MFTFWSKAWRVITPREILKDKWKMKGILDEPPCRASMKNSGNKRMIERKGSWKHKVKPCDYLEGASRWYNWENLELQKEKMNNKKPRIYSSWIISVKRIESPRGNKKKIYCMLILHQIKLMTSNGFGILLILIKGLKRDIAPTWRSYWWDHRWDLETTNIWYDNEGSEILNGPP